MLNRSRSVFSIHKALVDSREVKATTATSKLHDNMVNLIDHTNNETMKYCDMNNIGNGKEIFKTKKTNMKRKIK